MAYIIQGDWFFVQMCIWGFFESLLMNLTLDFFNQYVGSKMVAENLHFGLPYCIRHFDF